MKLKEVIKLFKYMPTVSKLIAVFVKHNFRDIGSLMDIYDIKKGNIVSMLFNSKTVVINKPTTIIGDVKCDYLFVNATINVNKLNIEECKLLKDSE